MGTPETLLNYNNRDSTGLKHKLLLNVDKSHFWAHTYFKLVHARDPLSNWDYAQLARAQIQVCVFPKQSSCPMGCAIVIFGLFCCCHTFPLKCLFYTPNWLLGGPRTGPNFFFYAVPHPAIRCIYIYIYIYICCEVIIWAKFCHFRCYYLGQVGVIIWAKLFLAYKNSGFKRFLHTQLSFSVFFVPNYLAVI